MSDPDRRNGLTTLSHVRVIMFGMLSDFLEVFLAIVVVLLFVKSGVIRQLVGTIVMSYVTVFVGVIFVGVFLDLAMVGNQPIPCLIAAGLIVLAFVVYFIGAFLDLNKALGQTFAGPPKISDPITPKECERLAIWAELRNDEEVASDCELPKSNQRKKCTKSVRRRSQIRLVR
jgi:hypothetical protein